MEMSGVSQPGEAGVSLATGKVTIVEGMVLRHNLIIQQREYITARVSGRGFTSPTNCYQLS